MIHEESAENIKSRIPCNCTHLGRFNPTHNMLFPPSLGLADTSPHTPQAPDSINDESGRPFDVQTLFSQIRLVLNLLGHAGI